MTSTLDRFIFICCCRSGANDDCWTVARLMGARLSAWTPSQNIPSAMLFSLRPLHLVLFETSKRRRSASSRPTTYQSPHSFSTIALIHEQMFLTPLHSAPICPAHYRWQFSAPFLLCWSCLILFFIRFLFVFFIVRASRCLLLQCRRKTLQLFRAPEEAVSTKMIVKVG